MYNELKAALLIAPKNDIRFYLNGVRIMRNGDTLRISVTDGHMLADISINLLLDAFRDYRQTIADDTDVIIPRTELDAALKLHKKNDQVPMIIDDKVKTVGLVAFEPIDGRFPAIDRVIDANAGSNDKHEATTGIGLGFAKLEQVGKVGKAFNPADKYAGFRTMVKGATDTVRFETTNRDGADMILLLSPMRL